MSHPDTCWRVAVVYRCYVRYGKTKEWVFEELSKISKDPREKARFKTLGEIWFRQDHLPNVREAFLKGESYP